MANYSDINCLDSWRGIGARLGCGVAISGFAGFVTSTINNPFVAKSGLVKGVFEHALVGASTSIDTVVMGAVSAVLFGAVGFVVRRGEGVKAGLVLGVLGGGLWGGIGGYNHSSSLLNRSALYKTAAIESTAPAIKHPVRYVACNYNGAQPEYLSIA
jgi:hypothetical protein